MDLISRLLFVAVFILAAFTTTVNAQESKGQREAVEQIQKALKEKGHDPGPIDGVPGLKTNRAIRSFQTSQSLTASGQVDEKTAAALGVPMPPRPLPPPNGSKPNPPKPPKPKPGPRPNHGPKP
jgi:peptidoglycan hydrolase-like protein with peptidoglycan-binding domain